MNKLVMLVSILRRNLSETAVSFLNENGISVTLGRYGRGTATKEIFKMFMPDREKCVLFSIMPYKISKRIMQDLLDVCEHAGVTFTLPITSVGGENVYKYLEGKNKVEEESNMEVKIENELIIAVTNRGYTDNVMSVAREAGARGGTVIHARGTGDEASEKFFGETVGAEREMIFIVVSKEDKKNVMNAIMEKVGINSDAQTFIFTLPVIDVAK